MTTPSQLSKKNLSDFSEKGYFVLSNVFSEPWLQALSGAVNWWSQLGYLLDADRVPLTDHGMMRNEQGNFVFYVGNLHNKGRVESLELLGHPAILDIARTLCGSDAFCTFESASILQEFDQSAIPWHQARIHDSGQPIIQIGIYLDDATPGNGAPTLAPGTQKEKQNMCELIERVTADGSSLVSPTLSRGDILIYDKMLALTLPQGTVGPVRSIELEFRSQTQAREEAKASDEWIEQRLQLQNFASKVYDELHASATDEESFANNDDRARIFKENLLKLDEFYALKRSAEVANLCLEFKTGDRVGDG